MIGYTPVDQDGLQLDRDDAVVNFSAFDPNTGGYVLPSITADGVSDYYFWDDCDCNFFEEENDGEQD